MTFVPSILTSPFFFRSETKEDTSCAVSCFRNVALIVLESVATVRGLTAPRF